MEPIRFIHIADTHLGKRQYNLQERYDDYFSAFKWILGLAINEEVDFLLIAGDIFDKKNVNPSVLSQLFYIIRDFKDVCVEKLKRNIPLICIEGNHDNPIYTTHSWMSFLADLDLIILLSGDYDRDSKTLDFKPYSSKTHRGGMYQIKDTRIYGLPFFGSFTSSLFSVIKKEIPKEESNFNILMMHFGVEGQDKVKPGIELSNSLKNLHEGVDYLALGHFHKQYKIPDSDPWIFNPGSLEINDLSEINENITRGAFLVEISGKEYYKQKKQFLICENGNSDPNLIPNRKFVKITDMNISDSNTFEEAIVNVLDRVQKWGLTLNDPSKDKKDLNCPIVFFSLFGEISYSRLEININKLRDEIKKKFYVLDVRIFSYNLFSKIDQISISDDEMTIDEIEKEIFSLIIEENPQLSPNKNKLLNLLNDFKINLTQTNPDYSVIHDQISEWCVLNIEGFQKPRKIEPPKAEIEVEVPVIEDNAKKEELSKAIKEREKLLEKLTDDTSDKDSDFDPYGDFEYDKHIDDGTEED